jgi:hypothetical protein
MASRRNRTINLPAPYLRRVWLDPSGIAERAAYPFCLPFLQDDFELSFDRSITIIVGEKRDRQIHFPGRDRRARRL